MSQRRAHVHVRGRVQGVNFRYYTMQEARKLGVTGWVRNLIDGRVEAIFEGEDEAVESMVNWCRHGPPSAAVEDVEVLWVEPTGEFSDFGVRGYY